MCQGISISETRNSSVKPHLLIKDFTALKFEDVSIHLKIPMSKLSLSTALFVSVSTVMHHRKVLD